MSESESPDNQYIALFSDEKEPSAREKKALDLALEIRKFEIELYWKRATYFWVFTGAALGAYLAALTSGSLENRPVALLLTACIGLVFSIAWYFVNRASKYWQTNWEAHVDLLEDHIFGSLYKTVINSSHKWWRVEDPYPFSVSKINQLLSLYVTAIFFFLVGHTLYTHYGSPCEWNTFTIGLIALTILSIVLFICLGRTGGSKRDKHARVRKTTLSSYEEYDS